MTRDQRVKAMERVLMSVSTPLMNGDNLAVLLCSFFDDGGPDVDGYGWSQSALDGYNEVKTALVAAALTAFDGDKP